MININRCQVKYSDRVVLDIDKSIHIAPGDRVGIIGSNGAGKSTLIKSILGLTNYQGSIELGIRQSDIAVHMQFNNYTENVSIGIIMEMILGCRLSEHRAATELIEYFEFEKCLKKRYKQLSGGEKQRLTMILVMCADSQISIFDEVTSGLDFETRQRLMEKMNSYYENKKNTLLIVSHYYEELDYLCDKLLYLDGGRVMAYGKKSELCRKYCGKTILTTRSKDSTRALLQGYRLLNSPGHIIAVSCDDESTELELTRLFIENNIDYKRSQEDIEIMTMNVGGQHE